MCWGPFCENDKMLVLTGNFWQKKKKIVAGKEFISLSTSHCFRTVEPFFFFFMMLFIRIVFHRIK